MHLLYITQANFEIINIIGLPICIAFKLNIKVPIRYIFNFNERSTLAVIKFYAERNGRQFLNKG